MSLESGSYPPDNEVLVDLLFPKVLANHISKREEFAELRYDQVLELCARPDMAVEDRVVQVAATAGRAALTDELQHEVTILRLCALGRETEVDDAQRQASYRQSDINQTKDAVSLRNLDHYLAKGIEVIFEPDVREKVLRYCSIDQRQVPLVEKLKAQRLVEINGFANSRIMYAVHDMIDHAWLFNMMRENGIMDRYADFLAAIDMEDSAFLYSRQAELLASIGFGSRRWAVAISQGEALVLGEHHIQSVLRSKDDPRAVHAADLLESMDPTQRTQAVFMVENMAIQFSDERRRWGSVKMRGNSRAATPLALFDPMHISIMIETLHLIQGNKNFQTAQFAATVAVEHMLETVLDDEGSETTIAIPIPKPNNSEITIAEEKLEWLRRHPSVSTSYNRID